MFMCVEACLLLPMNISNAVLIFPNQGLATISYIQGDKIAYKCAGEYLWGDRTSGDKSVACQQDGSWSTISETCKSLL